MLTRTPPSAHIMPFGTLPRFWARSAATPQAAPGVGRLLLQARKQARMQGVRREDERAGEAAADERGVDELSVHVHVGEQAPVLVAQLAVEAKVDLLTLNEAGVEATGGVPEALNRLARSDRLGRVDADVAHVLLLAIQPDFDRVAVDDAQHATRHRAAGSRLARVRRVIATGRDRERERKRGGADAPRAHASMRAQGGFLAPAAAFARGSA